MGANQNSSMEFDLYPEINPRSSLLIRQDRVAIEKLSAIGTGLGTMKTQQKITIDASHDTCETMTAKSESKGSSNPHRHFTEHLADVFEEPPRESLENLKLFYPIAQDKTDFHPATIHRQHNQKSSWS
jgi:hypothetical protein